MEQNQDIIFEKEQNKEENIEEKKKEIQKDSKFQEKEIKNKEDISQVSKNILIICSIY